MNFARRCLQQVLLEHGLWTPTRCQACGQQLAHGVNLGALGQFRTFKSSKRRVDVIMLKDVPEHGLHKFQVAQVRPGSARNHLVPGKLAVYGHYLNKDKYRNEIELAERDRRGTRPEESMLKEEQKKAKLMKKLRSLKLVDSVPSLNNKFVQPYGVRDIVKAVMRKESIELAPELLMIEYPFEEPGTYTVPLAVLDDEGTQLQLTLQLAPKDVGVDASPSA